MDDDCHVNVILRCYCPSGLSTGLRDVDSTGGVDDPRTNRMERSQPFEQRELSLEYFHSMKSSTEKLGRASINM